MSSARSRTRLLASALGFLCALIAVGCNGHGTKPKPKDERAVPKVGAELKYGLTAEQAAKVLVRIGDKRITLGEFAQRLGGQSPYLRARYNSPERRREFLENMVRFELLAGEAKKRGYDQSQDVERVRKQVMVQQMMQDLFDKGGIKLSDIGDAAIKQYYEQHRSEFERPAQVRASHILFKDRASAEKVLRQLKQAPDDMELFRKLARAHNTDSATKDAFGDLRFFSETKDPSGESDEPERPAAVRKAAFSLEKIGDLYPEVVRSERGFHVVKLTGKREAMHRSLEDARRMIQNTLWRKRRQEAIEKFVAGLRQKANVKVDPQALAKVRVKDATGESVAVGDGQRQEAAEPATPAEPATGPAKPVQAGKQ